MTCRTSVLPKIKTKVHSPLFLLVILLCFGIDDLFFKATFLDLPPSQKPDAVKLYASATIRTSNQFVSVGVGNPGRREGAGTR